jgi:hypothetical protein
MPVDTTAQPAAPKAGPRKSGIQKSTGKAAPEDALKSRASGLYTWFQIGAMASIARGNFADAGAIEEHAPQLCQNAALYAEENETAAKAIDYFCQAGPVAVLIASAMPLILQLLANHSRIDASKLGAVPGVVPPDVLEKRVMVRMMRERAEYERQAQEAQREYDELRLRNGDGSNGTRVA